MALHSGREQQSQIYSVPGYFAHEIIRHEQRAYNAELIALRFNFSGGAGGKRKYHRRARAAAAADKAVVQFLDRDEKTVVSLSPAQESLLYEKGRDMGIIPEDGSPTKKPAYTGEKVPQFSYGKLKPAQKAQLLRTVYLKLTGEQEPSKPPADIGLLFRQPKRYITGPYSPETLNLLETGQAEQMREAGFSDQQIMDYYLNYE